MAKDRFSNTIRQGYKVADLRDNSKKTGIVVGTAIERILVKWDDNDDEEWMDCIDVVHTNQVFGCKRGNR